MDISGLLSSTGINLEAQAFKAFGAAVSSQLPGTLAATLESAAFGTLAPGSNLGSFGNGSPYSSGPDGASRDWNVTPYASAIASGIGGYDPKQKFLFKVSFSFYPEAAQMAQALGVDVGNVLSRDLTYVIKQIDLPKYTFEYDEVNMYNFRTKVLTKIKHEELNFKFFDDVANNAVKFVNTYLQILVPLSRQSWTSNYALEDHGFAFSSDPSTPDTSMRAPIGPHGSSRGILNSMTIEQYYLDRSNNALVGAQIRQAIKVNSYIFTNPRLTNFTIDEQDHEGGTAPNFISCGFDFDALYIKTGEIADSIDRPSSGFMETNDILSGGGSSTGASGLAASGGFGGNGISQFTSSIAAQGLRMPSMDFASAIPKSFMSLSPGGALGDVTSQLTTAFGTNASRTLAALGGGIGSAITPPTLPFLSDDSAGGGAMSQVSDAVGDFTDSAASTVSDVTSSLFG